MESKPTHLRTPGRLQSVWKSPLGGGGEELLTLIVMVARVDALPAASLYLASTVWDPSESELVFRPNDQFVVPAADEKLPPSTRTCKEVTPTMSEAVP